MGDGDETGSVFDPQDCNIVRNVILRAEDGREPASAHARLPQHPFKKSMVGVLYGGGHVAARNASRHVTKHMNITQQ